MNNNPQTATAAAKALGVSRKVFYKHLRNQNWPKPPWTATQFDEYYQQLQTLRAMAPNSPATASLDDVSDELLQAKLALLTAKITRLEMENWRAMNELVPRTAVAESRMEVILTFKAFWDTIGGHAYELTGRTGPEIAATIKGWHNEWLKQIDEPTPKDSCQTWLPEPLDNGVAIQDNGTP